MLKGSFTPYCKDPRSPRRNPFSLIWDPETLWKFSPKSRAQAPLVPGLGRSGC
jgi:hypothetical protein